jgi:hypothetical protein
MKNAVFCDVKPCGAVRTDVSEEPSVSIINVTRICEIRTMLCVISNRHSISSQRASVASYD